MLSPQEVKEKLQDRKLAAVSKKTGLHYNTLRKLRDEELKEPAYETIKTLSEYFEAD